jgi:hypothetical protein
MLRHRDANIDLEQIAVTALHRRCDDRHVTAGDPVMEFFQPPGLAVSPRKRGPSAPSLNTVNSVVGETVCSTIRTNVWPRIG